MVLVGHFITNPLCDFILKDVDHSLLNQKILVDL